MRVGVVGAGVMGLATAAALARRGVEVDVYEQFALDHVRGSSHGSTRIFRLAYPDAEWVALARRAFEQWRALEQETGTELLRLDGLLELGATSEAALDSASVGFAWLGPEDAEHRFGVRADGPALFQPDAGCLYANRARQALLRAATERGAALHEDARAPSLDDVDADVVVVTAGAWAAPLLAKAGIHLPAVVTRETVVYFRAEEAVPSVIDYGDGRGPAAYALHDPEHGLKAGMHHGGTPADPDEDGAPDEAVVAAVVEWVARRLPQVDPRPAALDTCLYTTTPDERFVLERHGRVVVGSACSGHGFKFAPVVGERLAELALAP